MFQIIILLLKFISALAAFEIGLDLFFNANFIEIMYFSMLLTIVSYLAGDRILLPRIGNSNALVIDFFLAYMCVWIFGPKLFNSYIQIAWGSMISALLIISSEALIHRYLFKVVDSRKGGGLVQADRKPQHGYRMELAKEQKPLEEEGD